MAASNARPPGAWNGTHAALYRLHLARRCSGRETCSNDCGSCDAMRTISSALALLLALASPAAAFELKSPDIADGQRMSKAQVYTRCGGDNVSPALEWSGAPAGTKSFVLTMIDQSVSPSQWSHWVVVDLPANTTALAHNDSLPDGAHGIVSNFGDANYDGPCPPIRTGLHHYRITIWA